MARDIYIAIMVAAAKGQGLRLTAKEVFGLSLDDAIAYRADYMLGDGPVPGDWSKINPRRARKSRNQS